METHRLVLPGDLNHYGYLFGGRLLAWVDEASLIAATADFPGCHFVTIAMDEVIFRHSIQNGTILSIDSQKVKQGTTSVTYQVEVFQGKNGQGNLLFSTKVTFVNLDKNGVKRPLTS